MEQLIFLIIIYVVYVLFNNFVKKLKEQQKPPPGRPGQRPPASRPPQPGPQTQTPPREPELDLPPFLKEMLGLEKPQPQPLPEPAAEEETAEKTPAAAEEPVLPTGPERIPASARMEADEIEDLSQPFPTPKEKTKTHIQELLGNRQNLQSAFLLKEILDAPVSKRGMRFPKFGNL